MLADRGDSLTLEAAADLACLERVHALVAELWTRAPDVQQRDRLRFETAVIEVAGNIVEHGGNGVRLALRLSTRRDAVEATFCDTGEPVDLDEVTSELSDPFAETGRGLALARAAADDVGYARTDTTNHWWVRTARGA